MSWQDILKNMPEKWDKMGNLFQAYIFDESKSMDAEQTLEELYKIYSGGKSLNDTFIGADTPVDYESRSPEVMRDD